MRMTDESKERVLWWLAPWRWRQCMAEKDCGHNVIALCIRRKGHPGHHETANGESWPRCDR